MVAAQKDNERISGSGARGRVNANSARRKQKHAPKCAVVSSFGGIQNPVFFFDKTKKKMAGLEAFPRPREADGIAAAEHLIRCFAFTFPRGENSFLSPLRGIEWTIPQSASLTAPFAQRGLFVVRREKADAQQHLALCARNCYTDKGDILF
ncbi:MAG: hypothetical protein Q3977_05450 [Oscillospiraceae bacterium]|nr:hypothetical protein [Oscillospiraceae bacterium]